MAKPQRGNYSQVLVKLRMIDKFFMLRNIRMRFHVYGASIWTIVRSTEDWLQKFEIQSFNSGENFRRI